MAGSAKFCVCIVIYGKPFALKHQNWTSELMCGDTSVRKELKLEQELCTSFIHLNEIYIPGSAVNVMQCPCCVLKGRTESALGCFLVF